MPNDEKFDAIDADVILRVLGPPKRDFRVHKLILSLASPVFKDMFSLPQPTTPISDNSTQSETVQTDIVEVTDPPRALDAILRMIYPFTPPSFNGNLDMIVECLTIADKYEIKGAMPQLRSALSGVNASQVLQVYAIASRFGFTGLVKSTSQHILSSVNLMGIPQLPNDFEFIAATTYHKLVRQHANRLEVMVEVVNRTPLKSSCYSCPGGKSFAVEVFRARLAQILMKGTPVMASACLEAWVKTYGHNSECENDCVVKFICSAISRVEKQLAKPETPPPQRKSILKA